ncbi:MAG: hypothetical protein AAGG02_21660 [Cyanobacteria bacterium P01_H01_bin.15]
MDALTKPQPEQERQKVLNAIAELYELQDGVEQILQDPNHQRMLERLRELLHHSD